MADLSNQVSREILIEENEDEEEDEVVVGEGNVPSNLTIKDENEKVIIQPCGNG